MEAALFLAIVFGGSILILVIIGSTIIMGIKMIKGGLSKTGQKRQSDEAKMVQEIYRGLSRMEERVETLETIILEGERKVRSL